MNPGEELNYEGAAAPASFQRVTLTRLLGVVGAIVHFIACATIDFQLFRAAGGISTAGAWKTYGGIDYAWANFAWLPAGVLLWIGDGGNFHRPVLGWAALLMLIAGSCFAGYLLAGVLVNAFRRQRNFGHFNWRLWAFAITWLVWIPVPVKMTISYWYTVAY